jgi:hypothetical protein
MTDLANHVRSSLEMRLTFLKNQIGQIAALTAGLPAMEAEAAEIEATLTNVDKDVKVEIPIAKREIAVEPRGPVILESPVVEEQPIEP